MTHLSLWTDAIDFCRVRLEHETSCRTTLNVDFYRVALDCVILPSLWDDAIDFCRVRLEHETSCRTALNVDFYRVVLDCVILRACGTTP